jgi:competence CoiA-like predicted nuclease
MPLTAYHTSQEEVVSVLDYEDPKSELDATALICPTCKNEMHVCAPEFRVTHFRHNPGADCERGGESIAHLVGKMKVAQMLRSKSDCVDVWIEQKLEMGRRPDVLCRYSGGQFVAHEVQLSEVGKNEIRDRTGDYWEEGIAVHWWFGDNVPESLVNWTVRAIGGCSTLSFGVQTEEEDLGG